jgi:4,5-DOPA dioxygenase extradiol
MECLFIPEASRVTLPAMSRLPTLFLSHGSPMHAIESGLAGAAWQQLAQALPRPRAVLMVSAHWETAGPMLTGGDRPETIHDFGGFPPELYALRYPAPGSPQLAQQAAALLEQAGHPASVDGSRGLDHGAWVPLRRMYPQHEVPVVQLSVQPALGPGHHLRVGEALAPLAADGVLVIGSGHVTHNLRDWMTQMRAPSASHGGGAATAGAGAPAPLPYVVEFSDWLDDRLAHDDREAVLAYRERGPSAARAHPTEEHFLPLFVAWGAAGEGARARRVHRGIEAAALSMDAYRFDAAARSAP